MWIRSKIWIRDYESPFLQPTIQAFLQFSREYESPFLQPFRQLCNCTLEYESPFLQPFRDPYIFTVEYESPFLQPFRHPCICTREYESSNLQPFRHSCNVPESMNLHMCYDSSYRSTRRRVHLTLCIINHSCNSFGYLFMNAQKTKLWVWCQTPLFALLFAYHVGTLHHAPCTLPLPLPLSYQYMNIFLVQFPLLSIKNMK